MARLNVALFGAGVMGSNHARVIANSQFASLGLVVDPNESAGRDLAERYQTRWLPELEDYRSFDAIVVATATETHFEIVVKSLESGTAALVEKPLTPSLSQTELLINLALEHEVPLMCGLLERFNPAIVTARAIASEPIQFLAVRHSPFTPRIKTHVAWDLLVHDVDLACTFLASEVSRVAAMNSTINTQSVNPDICDAVIQYKNASIANVSANRMGQKKIRTATITERNRVIEVDLLRRNLTLYKNVTEDLLVEGRGYRQEAIIEIPELVSSQEPLVAQFDRFIQLLNSGEGLASEAQSLIAPHTIVDLITRESAIRE